MTAVQAPATPPGPAPVRRLRRDPSEGIVAGVCAGAGRRFGLDPIVPRVLVVLAAALGGAGVVLYALAWALIPADERADRVPRARTGSWQVGAGVALLALAALLFLREAGLLFAEAVLWPLVLAAGGVALVWRQTAARPLGPLVPPGVGARGRAAGVPPGAPAGSLVPARSGGPAGSAPSAAVGGARASVAATAGTGLLSGGPGAVGGAVPAAGGAVAADGSVAVAAGTEPAAVAREHQSERLAGLYRGGFGVALIAGSGLLVLQTTGALSAARELLLAAVVVTVGLALVLAPFLWRIGESLASERAARIRSEERAEVAAHLHDSVLQTLALVQKRADDPRAVAALARRQERELRSWLGGERPADPDERFAAALEAAATEVEDAHGARVELVAVGDAPLDERARATVGAAREAMVNAAKFAGEAGPVAVYAEATDRALEVFVRDRGPGFDPARVPGDRRGVRESIVGRMARHGGEAVVHAAPGAGVEVELRMTRDADPA